MPQSYDYMLDPPDYDEEEYCEECGEHYEHCDCYADEEPDDYVSDEEADMAADRYFGDI